MPRRFGLALVALPVAAIACAVPPTPPVAPQATTTTSPPVLVSPPSLPPMPPAEARPPTTGATCAGDAAWVSSIGGKPLVSTLMRFDAMRRRGGFGPDPIDTFNDLTYVRRSSQEKYEWPGADPEDRHPDLVVLRGASGNVPKGYGSSTTHPSGVVEHGPGARHPRLPPSGFSLFVFPDGTWVRTEGASMTTRFRDLFAIAGASPPVPSADPDVAWEICGTMDVNELALPFDVWAIEGQRVAVRLFASRQEGELVYPFTSPELATQAAREQAAVCARSRCGWLTSTSVEGPIVRYGTRIRTAPTSGRTVLEIAQPTPHRAAPPPANAPATPGALPSGVYQHFVDMRSDTCPTHGAGQRYPSMMTTVLVTHKNGKAFTTLESVDVLAKGVLGGTAMKDVELTAGTVVKKAITHLCPNYAIEHTITVLSVSGDTIRAKDEVRYVGSTAGCRHANLPSNCGGETLATWTLARKSCDARCDASLEGRGPSFGQDEPAPKLDVKCSCP